MFLQSSALATWSLPVSPSLSDLGEIDILLSDASSGWSGLCSMWMLRSTGCVWLGREQCYSFWEVPLQSPTLYRGTWLQPADCTRQTSVPAWLRLISVLGNQDQQGISYPALFSFFHKVLLNYPPTLK